MEIFKAATDWAKAEVLSSVVFIFFGLLFVLAAGGFWQSGKTEIARAFIFPTLIAGILLLTVGLGLFFTNKSRVVNFTAENHQDTAAFVQSEIVRAEKAMSEYKLIVFKIIPLIIVVAALLIVFIDKPIWRAISITTIAMLIVILLVDANADARIQDYNKQLKSVEKALRN